MLRNDDDEIFFEKIMILFVDLSIFANDKVGVDFGFSIVYFGDSK